MLNFRGVGEEIYVLDADAVLSVGAPSFVLRIHVKQPSILRKPCHGGGFNPFVCIDVLFPKDPNYNKGPNCKKGSSHKLGYSL